MRKEIITRKVLTTECGVQILQTDEQVWVAPKTPVKYKSSQTEGNRSPKVKYPSSYGGTFHMSKNAVGIMQDPSKEPAPPKEAPSPKKSTKTVAVSTRMVLKEPPPKSSKQRAKSTEGIALEPKEENFETGSSVPRMMMHANSETFQKFIAKGECPGYKCIKSVERVEEGTMTGSDDFNRRSSFQKALQYIKRTGRTSKETSNPSFSKVSKRSTATSVEEIKQIDESITAKEVIEKADTQTSMQSFVRENEQVRSDSAVSANKSLRRSFANQELLSTTAEEPDNELDEFVQDFQVKKSWCC